MPEALERLGVHLPSLAAYLVNFLVLMGVLYLIAHRPFLRVLNEPRRASSAAWRRLRPWSVRWPRRTWGATRSSRLRGGKHCPSWTRRSNMRSMRSPSPGVAVWPRQRCTWSEPGTRVRPKRRRCAFDYGQNLPI